MQFTPITPDQARRIAEAAGGLSDYPLLPPALPEEEAAQLRLAAFATCLTQAAISYLHDRHWQDLPTLTDTKKQLDRIAAAGKRLSRALEATDRLEVRTWLMGAAEDQGKAQATIAQLRGALPLVASWADEASRIVATRIDPADRTRHTADAALHKLYATLAEIYADFFKQEPGASTSPDGDAGGPCIRFVESFFTAMRENLSPGSNGDLRPTKEAIRARLRLVKSKMEKS
jgi:hypothetical protein